MVDFASPEAARFPMLPCQIVIRFIEILLDGLRSELFLQNFRDVSQILASPLGRQHCPEPLQPAALSAVCVSRRMAFGPRHDIHLLGVPCQAEAGMHFRMHVTQALLGIPADFVRRNAGKSGFGADWLHLLIVK